MKKLLLAGLAFYSLFFCLLSYADMPDKSSFAATEWISRSPNQLITIENGTNASLAISIVVNHPGTDNPPGINIKNCGSTTRIRAGSTAVCVTNDGANPVSFSSESSNVENPVTGTYQIKPLWN